MLFKFKVEDIKYLKVLFKDINEESVLLKIALKQINDREILACGKISENMVVPTPQDVSLSIICNDGLYRTKAKLKSVSDENPYTFFIMETPKNVEYQQNREYFRVVTEFPCTYKAEGKEYSAKTYDISANGVSLLLNSHTITDGVSNLILNVNNRNLQVPMYYVRSEKINNQYKVSFKFVKISEIDRDFISQICIQKQLEAKRNSLL